MYLTSKRRLLSIVLTLSLLSGAVGTQTACPKPSQSSIDKAAKASATIAVRYVETVDFVTVLYTSGTISLELKDKIADGLIAFGENGKKFNALLKTLSEQYRDGDVPANVWTTISENFDKLSAEFLKVISLLPQASGLGDSKAFRAISAAVLALAQILASHSIIPESQMRQIETEVNRHGLV